MNERVNERVNAVVIAGATACEKTSTAIALAREFGGELIGADSVQVYRGFDIGSAKPDAQELGGIFHHLIDVLDPNERIDAADYAGRADIAAQTIVERGSVPIVVGGTGLWIRAWHLGLFDAPKVDAHLRASLEREADEHGVNALHNTLARLDPKSAEWIHPNDRLRIVRAIEVYKQTGRQLSELQAEHAQGKPRHNVFFVVLEHQKEPLLKKIEKRTDAMLKRGWLEEVRSIVDRWGPEVRPLGSVGYSEVVRHLEGELDATQMREAIIRSTRLYARRQRTWFNAERHVDLRIEPTVANLDAMRRKIGEHLEK